MQPSGQMLIESQHICDMSGSWVPDVTNLQCVDVQCPQIQNVPIRSLSG